MSEYQAPLRDMQFMLRELAPVEQLTSLPGCEEVNLELATAILEEAGKFANGVLSPLNVIGDREGARWKDGEVLTATGWRSAYQQFVEGGWNALSCDPAHGGQGLPRRASVGAAPLLELFGIVSGGWQMARAALASRQHLTEGAGDAGFHTAKLHTARFYADHVLSRASGLSHSVVHGADAALAIDEDQLF